MVQRLTYRRRHSYAPPNPTRRHSQNAWPERSERTVNRANGGVISASAFRERVIRAFLVEERKIVKKVLKIRKTKEKQACKV